MKSFYKDLFEYNHQSNQKLIEIFSLNSDKVSEKSIELFSHILNAQHIWNHRIQGVQPQCGVWEVHKIEDFGQFDIQNHEDSLRILVDFELERSLSYKNSRGQSFENSVQHILFHVINHSTYHRGQIASEFRTSGVEPASTDYIFYKR